MNDDNTAPTEGTETPEVKPAVTPASALLGVEKSEPDNSAVESNNDSEYSWVPQKFMKDGNPDYKTLAESYTELSKKLGERQGAETVDDYNFDTKSNDVFSDTFIPELKTQALELGLSGEQFNGFATTIESVVSEYKKSFDDLLVETYGTAETTEKTLRDAWGDDFDKNLKLVDRAWNAYKPEGADANSMTNDPVQYFIYARIGAELGEDKVVTKSGYSGPSIPTEAELFEVMSDPRYYDQTSGLADKAAEMISRMPKKK